MYAQDLPVGYISYYSQKANNERFLDTITTCTPQYWKINANKSFTILHPIETDSLADSTFLINMGIVKNMIFGEYIMEFEYRINNLPNTDSSGFCLLGPVKSAATYYLFIFGTDTVVFYYINKGIPEEIGCHELNPLNNQWNKMRVTRDILNRSIAITLNRDADQQVIFYDPRLVMGFVGFGTLLVQSSIRNINIWAPTVIIENTFTCN